MEANSATVSSMIFATGSTDSMRPATWPDNAIAAFVDRGLRLIFDGEISRIGCITDLNEDVAMSERERVQKDRV